MGMDVYGKKPANEVGEYFRRNVWGWRPLWQYCVDTHPELANKVKNAQYNSGGGLNAKKSILLAQLLKEDLANGNAERYVANRNKELADLPRVECELCSGTGIRTDKVGVENGMSEMKLLKEVAIILGREVGWCNGCNGEGLQDDWAIHYSLDVQDIIEFADFLENSGGFEIW